MSEKKTEKQILFEQAVDLGFVGTYESKSAAELQEFIDAATSGETTPEPATDPAVETPAEPEPQADDKPKKPPGRPKPKIVDCPLSINLPLDKNAPDIFVGRDLRKFSRRMGPEVTRTFQELFAGLSNADDCRLADGSRITDPGEVLLYLLEQITTQRGK